MRCVYIERTKDVWSRDMIWQRLGGCWRRNELTLVTGSCYWRDAMIALSYMCRSLRLSLSLSLRACVKLLFSIADDKDSDDVMSVSRVISNIVLFFILYRSLFVTRKSNLFRCFLDSCHFPRCVLHRNDDYRVKFVS